MSAGSLTATQRAYNVLREEIETIDAPEIDTPEASPEYRAGLARAMALLLEMDEDADPGPSIPGRVY